MAQGRSSAGRASVSKTEGRRFESGRPCHKYMNFEKAYQERTRRRAIQRVYGVSRSTLANWIKKKSTVYLR